MAMEKPALRLKLLKKLKVLLTERVTVAWSFERIGEYKIELQTIGGSFFPIFFDVNYAHEIIPS